METKSSIKHYTTRNDYLSKRGAATAKEVVENNATKLPSDKKAHKVDISDKAKEAKSKLKDTVKTDGKTLKKAGSHLLADAASSIAKALPSPIPSKIPFISASSKDKIRSGDVKKIKEASPINKPGIFFISGLKLATLSSDDGSMGALSEAVKGGQHFSWQDEDKIVEEILRRPNEQPIVLVGHSLGGDAAVSIANRLNTLKGGFKKVNLLVTMDSVGFNNDIVPQNVSKNLNFISDDDYFFNDGPNIARNSKLTNVINHLRSEEHTDIDDAEDVHFEIVSGINEVLKSQKQDMKFQKLSSLFKTFIDTNKTE